MAANSQKKVEHTVGKGEIARYEQFLLFPQCFQKTCTANTSKPGLVWERVDSRIGNKGENAGYQHFLFFQQGFLSYQI